MAGPKGDGKWVWGAARGSSDVWGRRWNWIGFIGSFRLAQLLL